MTYNHISLENCSLVRVSRNFNENNLQASSIQSFKPSEKPYELPVPAAWNHVRLINVLQTLTGKYIYEPNFLRICLDHCYHHHG